MKWLLPATRKQRRRILGVGVLLWLLSVIFQPIPRVVLDEPQQVYAVHEHVCVHTRLIDEVEERVIQRSLQLVREMGADTIVEFFPWAYVERSPGDYDWAQADRIVRHAENQGIRIIARMGLVPEWARLDDPDEPTTFNHLPDDAVDEFADFVARFAERYAGRIDHLIIWNEPNLAFEWGYEEVNVEKYVRLLEAVYTRVKAANPDTRILAGALAPTLEPEDSPHGTNDLLYLEQMYAAGAAQWFDALAVHTYGFQNPPEQAPAEDRLNFRRYELLREIMQRYDDAATPVLITESGWNDHPRWTLSVRPSQRIAYTIRAFEYVDEHWPEVEELCIWAFRYPLPTLSYPDNYTLVTTDFQRKPIYHAIQAYAQGREGSRTLWLPPPGE